MGIVFTSDIMVLVGRPKNRVAHSHHAIQVVFSEAPLIINSTRFGKSVIINSNAKHFLKSDGLCVSFMIEPQSKVGKSLSKILGNHELVGFEHEMGKEIARLFEGGVSDEEALELLEKFKRAFSGNDFLDERIESIIVHINSKSGQELTIESLAAHCHLSPTRFRHLFKQEVGLSVMRYLKWVKLLSATRYIIENDVTISSGAHRFGFSDDAHFARTFKSTFGINFKSILMDKKHGR